MAFFPQHLQVVKYNATQTKGIATKEKSWISQALQLPRMLKETLPNIHCQVGQQYLESDAVANKEPKVITSTMMIVMEVKWEEKDLEICTLSCIEPYKLCSSMNSKTYGFCSWNAHIKYKVSGQNFTVRHLILFTMRNNKKEIWCYNQSMYVYLHINGKGCLIVLLNYIELSKSLQRCNKI